MKYVLYIWIKSMPFSINHPVEFFIIYLFSHLCFSFFGFRCFFFLIDFIAKLQTNSHSIISFLQCKASQLSTFHQHRLLLYIFSHGHFISRSTPQYLLRRWSSAPTAPTAPTPSPRTNKHLHHLIRQNPPPLLHHRASSPTTDYYYSSPWGCASRRPSLGCHPPGSIGQVSDSEAQGCNDFFYPGVYFELQFSSYPLFSFFFFDKFVFGFGSVFSFRFRNLLSNPHLSPTPPYLPSPFLDLSPTHPLLHPFLSTI